MSNCIATLREFAQTSLGTDLAGYAATDAAQVLLTNWNDALGDDTKDRLIQDVDQVIARLQLFRAEATKHLPVVNGGFASISLDAWKIRLENMDVEIYPCPQRRMNRFGFTGCEDSDYTSEADAIRAAVAHHFS